MLALASTSDRFTQFVTNLTLASDQVTDARTKYDGVAKKLHGHYFTTAFTGATRMLIGSYAKGLAVRPPRDVDILFLLPPTVYDRYKSRSGNVQSQLLQEVRAVLQERYPSTNIRGGNTHTEREGPLAPCYWRHPLRCWPFAVGPSLRCRWP